MSIKFRNNNNGLMFSSPAGCFQIPESEPIHLDLEKLFLLSVSKENLDFRRNIEKKPTLWNFEILKLSYFDLDAGFGSFPAVPRQDFYVESQFAVKNARF